MPTANVQEQKPLIPGGEHVLTLKSVTARTGDNPYKPIVGGGFEQQTRWLWIFHAEMLDPDGVPYEFAHWTSTYYGNPKSSLTMLYDSIMPGITIEQAAKFDTDKLLGRKFKVLLKHETSESGKTRAKLIRIDVVKGAKAAVPAPKPVEEEFDPFADE